MCSGSKREKLIFNEQRSCCKTLLKPCRLPAVLFENNTDFTAFTLCKHQDFVAGTKRSAWNFPRLVCFLVFRSDLFLILKVWAQIVPFSHECWYIAKTVTVNSRFPSLHSPWNFSWNWRSLDFLLAFSKQRRKTQTAHLQGSSKQGENTILARAVK